MERGRSGSLRRAVPLAIAPEVTSTIRRPSRIEAMSAASVSIRSGAAPAPGVVTRPLPTFTTSRRTRPSLRAAFMVGEPQDVAGLGPAVRGQRRRD